MKEASAEVNRMQITTASRFPFIYQNKKRKCSMSSPEASLRTGWKALSIFIPQKQWLNRVSVSSFQKLLFQKKKRVFFFFVFVLPFTVYSSYDLSARPVVQSHYAWIHHPTPPRFSLPVWFHAAKKGADSRRVRPFGRLAQSHDRADAVLQSGAAATTGLCGAEERKGAPLFGRVSEPLVWQIASLHMKHSQHLVARCRM